MMDKLKDRLKLLRQRVKEIKNFQIYLVVGMILIAAGAYFLSLPKQDVNKQETIDNNRTEFASSAEYVDYLENKLENVITSLKGVGQAEVVITLEKGFEYIYQTEEETRTTSNGTSVTSSTIVLIDGKPIVLKEIYPVICGIVVVAEGSGDVAVRMNIINVIQTVIDVETSQIKIMEGK
ncbi:MAG: hypothetical protein J6A28_00610 [Clostridia bacterium]|nr:hypothetical protein [Clostridia bacterium]